MEYHRAKRDDFQSRFIKYHTSILMRPKNRTTTHPGIVLLKEFLEPFGVTQKALADHLEVPVQRINEIIKGKRGITPETAWLLSDAFSTTPEFWMNLQATHDLTCHRPARKVKPISRS